MINTTNISQAKEQINKFQELRSQAQELIVKAQDNNFNRKLLEYGRFHMLLDIHSSSKNPRDKIKFLDSGLNHVLAKLATKNKIAIGIDINKIREIDKKQKALQLARIKQNIKICRKAKTQIRLLNYKDEKNAKALLLSLGAATEQVSEAIKTIYARTKTHKISCPSLL